jgi:hypothetical protein
MNSLQSSYQHDDVLIEELDEDSNPHIFYFNPLYVIAEEEVGQLVEIVMHVGEGGDMISKIIIAAKDLDAF